MTNIFDLKGKVAIVTGASKGIGEAIATLFASVGASVIVSSRKQEAVEKVAETIKANGGEATAIACHTGDLDQIGNLVKKTAEVYGTVDILVNNAATNPVFGPVVNTDSAAIDKIMGVNLKGPFELAKKVYPFMKEKRSGSIINMSSIGGLRAEPNLGFYRVSKAALISLTKVMAREWGEDNIRVNAICPGLIKTKFSEALWNNEKILNYMMKVLPIKRVGTSEEIAALALYLASDASAYSTGAVYTADGGFTI